MRNYNNYRCYYYIKVNNDLKQIINIACWYGLKNQNSYQYYTLELDQYNNPKRKVYTKNIEYIYIDEFRTIINSLANMKALINIINQITPCKIIIKNKKPYIQYKLISNGSYYNNLVLLNFIRMGWYKPDGFNYKQFFKDIRKKNVVISDPLYFLMEAVKNNILPLTNTYKSYMNHSLITPTIVPKNMNKLFSYKGNSMQKFLEQKII